MVVTMYTFANGDGIGHIYNTFNPREAEEYARRYHCVCFANEFEYSGRDVAWNYTEAPLKGADEDDEDTHDLSNYYRCSDCGHEWDEEWDCACVSTCPECAARDITPYKSEDH